MDMKVYKFYTLEHGKQSNYKHLSNHHCIHPEQPRSTWQVPVYGVEMLENDDIDDDDDDDDDDDKDDNLMNVNKAAFTSKSYKTEQTNIHTYVSRYESIKLVASCFKFSA